MRTPRSLPVRLRCALAASGVRESVAQLLEERASLGVDARSQLDRRLVEGDRAVERERPRRLVRRQHRIPRRMRGVARAAPVARERFGLAARRLLERHGERAMTGHAVVVGEVREDRRANAIVVRLDRIARARPGDAHEVRDAEQRDVTRQLRPVAADRAREHLLRDRRARDGEDLHDASRALGEGRDASPERVFEQCGRGRRAGDGRVPDERVDEERMASRLARDRLGELGSNVRSLALEELRREGSRVLLRHPRHRYRPGASRQRAADEVAELRGLACRGALIQRRRADRRDEEERRLVGRAHDLGEEREAVGVGPLEIVDDDEAGALGRQSREHLAERREGPVAELDRVGHDRGPARRVRDRSDATEHREELCERRRPRRENLLGE